MMSLFSRIIIIIFVTFATSFFVTIVSAEWMDAHATFYGDTAGHETEKGACGYDVFQDGYGLQTTALSTALFDGGAKCGACYEIVCADSRWCKEGAGPIRVTATNFCPPSTDPTAWCNPPWKHFDLSEPMFLNIAIYRGGIVPVKYRRVNCPRQGGVKFQINGNPYFLLVLVYNVAGAGDVTEMKVKGSQEHDEWITMSRNWGANFQVNGGYWPNKGLSFQVTISTGKMIQYDNVVPSNWSFGQSFQGHSNFY